MLGGKSVGSTAYLARDTAGRGRHSVDTKVAGVGVDGLDIGDPSLELVFSVVENISCGLGVSKGRMCVSRDNRSVVDKVEQLSCVLGQQDLLLGTLNDGGGVKIVGLLELLTGDVGELGLGDERLGFCADQLLFEGDDLGRAGLLVLELLDLVEDLDTQ